MRVEVYGVQFENKGAELMLLAIIDKLRKKLPQAELVLGPGRLRPYQKRIALGAYQYLSITCGSRELGTFLDKFCPESTLRNYGFVRRSSINLILDASGFAYGDNWGAAGSLRAERLYRKLRTTGSRIILMPQAMGPFVERRVRKAFGGLLEQADLVFARDKKSYQHVSESFGTRQSLTYAPDFTCLLPGTETKLSQWARGKVALIPNRRMLDMVEERLTDAYVPFMQACLKSLKDLGSAPFLLLHDEKDLHLAERIISSSGSNITIINEADPVNLKGIVGACQAVVGSRYHGLVSALSQGVPAIATGWSHKYQALMEDYELSEFIVDVTAGRDEIRERMHDLIVASQREEMLERLKAASVRQKVLSETMWQRVWKVAGVGEDQ